MTLRITIQHTEPASAYAVVVVATHGGNARRIQPGQIGEFYLHSAERFILLEEPKDPAWLAPAELAAASAPETRETPAVDPMTDHTLDDFHGQSVPRSSRITQLSATHWRGELGESKFEGDPASVAASLRQAAADAASFFKIN